MIDACDLTTSEVRGQYVTPLIQEILEKSGLIQEHAVLKGIDGIRCATSSDVPVSTLFQEIATEHSTAPVHENKDETTGEDSSDDRAGSSGATVRSYAEIIEEASALCAYMTSQEKTIVAAVTSSATLAFLIPQCNFSGFLHSYFSSNESSSATVEGASSSLEERLVNATLSNHNNTSGGVFPYSAPRMRSLVADNDGFTSSSLHRFLVQGLGPYLSSGMAFAFNYSNDLGGYKSILTRSGLDLIHLIAMAICPNPISVFHVGAPTSDLSMEADRGAGGEPGSSGMTLANSTLPFSFQLSHCDRLAMVRLCAELFIPENDYDPGCNAEGNSNNRDVHANFDAALEQLRSALFGFASYQAHSDEEAQVAYKSLTAIAMNGGKTDPAQFEFQRLLQAMIESRSSYLANAIGDCLVDLITTFNGSRYYADASFISFALGLLGKYIADMIGMSTEDGSKPLNPSKYTFLVNENATKRQKTSDGPVPAPKFCKPYHLAALMKVARPLFFFLLNTTAANKAKEWDTGVESEKETIIENAEGAARTQLIGDVTALLCYPCLAVLKSAAQLLALALAYNGNCYLREKANVRRLFRFTRQALDENADNSEEIVPALKPLIFTASRHSGTYAFSLMSYSCKVCPKNERLAWKVASVVSSAHPLAASNSLDKLKEISSISDDCGDIAREQIMARLSCAVVSCASPSLETVQRCISLTNNISSHWTLYQVVRNALSTGNFGFAHHIIEKRKLPQQCSSRMLLWMASLSNIAKGEEILGIKGSVGISEALEALHSCQSTLLTLTNLEQNHSTMEYRGKFGFQLELLRLRIDFLNLTMISRSLCTEVIVTGGNDSSARSNLFRQNISKGFAMLATRYMDFYRLFGLHYCQQTQSILRTLIAMSQLLSDFVAKILYSESKQQKKELIQSCMAKGDRKTAMGSLIARLRLGVLEKLAKSELSHAPELLDALDAIIRCPLPMPSGFLRVKSIPYSCVNLSVDPALLPKKQNEEHITRDAKGAQVVDLAPGVAIKLILSGVVRKAFIKSATVPFSQIIAWVSIRFDGQLYEDDDAEEAESTGVSGEEKPLDHLIPSDEPCSTALQSCSHFTLPVHIKPIMREGFYEVKVKMGVRDVRCSEWSLPTTKQPLQLFLRVEDTSE